MKYYSEVVNKVFDTEKDLKEAEAKFEEEKKAKVALREERASRAKEVNDAYKKYIELRAKFVQDYGSYHLSLTEKDLPALNSTSIFDLFNNFWF